MSIRGRRGISFFVCSFGIVSRIFKHLMKIFCRVKYREIKYSV